MSLEVTTRLAAAGDQAEVVRLLAAIRATVAGERGGDAWLATAAAALPLAPFVADELQDPAAAMLIGALDDVPVGLCHVRALRWRDGTMVAEVRHLFVDADAREIGVGEALLDAAIDWARSRGCTAIESVALPGDRALKNLFERFGVVARAIVVHKDLG